MKLSLAFAVLLSLILLTVCAIDMAPPSQRVPLARPDQPGEPLTFPKGEEAFRGDWPVYGNDAGGSRYSPLTQIDRGNVGQLRVAWI